MRRQVRPVVTAREEDSSYHSHFLAKADEHSHHFLKNTDKYNKKIAKFCPYIISESSCKLANKFVFASINCSYNDNNIANVDHQTGSSLCDLGILGGDGSDVLLLKQSYVPVNLKGVFSTCLDFRPAIDTSRGNTFQIATGLSNGTLCIHSFRAVEEHVGVLERSCMKNTDNDLVDIEVVQSFIPPKRMKQPTSVSWRPKDAKYVAIGFSSMSGRSTERRDFGCVVWDVEASSVGSYSRFADESVSPAKRTTPVYRFANSVGVSSLAWLNDGNVLAVGCEQKHIQLYDVRISGTNAPPLSVSAHDGEVSGIEVDPYRSNIFATFSKEYSSVKLWDYRRLENGSIGEIRTSSNHDSGGCINDIEWSKLQRGTIALATKNLVKTFDTMMTGSRPLPTGAISIPSIEDDLEFISFRPPLPTLNQPLQVDKSRECTTAVNTMFSPYRFISIRKDGRIISTPNFQNAPLAFHPANFLIPHSLGNLIFEGSLTDKEERSIEPDISSVMRRRAALVGTITYSINADVNIDVIKNELQLRNALPSSSNLSVDLVNLLGLWKWVSWVEGFLDPTKWGESIPWKVKGLIDAGIYTILEMESDAEDLQESRTVTPDIQYSSYHSPVRSTALQACGWSGKDGFVTAVQICESNGDFERAAALSVFNGDIASAVEILQKGAAERIRRACDSISSQDYDSRCSPEILTLIAMCIAGYNPSSSSNIWVVSTERLLERQELKRHKNKPHLAYLHALCTFLCLACKKNSFNSLLEDEDLCLSDRIGLAVRFMERKELRSYLQTTIEKCAVEGNLEGLVITGLNRAGIELLQSFVDLTGDVQTASIITSRVLFPDTHSNEKQVCSEWLESYRSLLNTWQMFHSRALFDVARANFLRQVQKREAEYMINEVKASYSQRKSIQKQLEAQASSVICTPTQLNARCNYCNTTLSLEKLRRQEGIGNSWLSRQKPVLSCCPTCRKPLPRCSICLLSLGCLNPYIELKRQRTSISAHGSAVPTLNADNDLTGLASLPFAEWFAWCIKCKHGGHAHCLSGWFKGGMKVCPVSGCDCQCQFDSVYKRPQYS